MKLILIVFCVLSFTACRENCAYKDQVQQLQSEMDAWKNKQVEFTPVKMEKELVHIVFLDLKDDISVLEKAELEAAVEDLRGIEVLTNLDIGEKAATQDPRFISDHEMVFSLRVKSLEDYKIYQEHPLHIKLKGIAKTKLTGAPAVYDFWTN